MHLMPFPGKFSLHHPDYGNNTICVGKECVGEKTDFHLDPTANANRISFELLLHNCIIFKSMSHSRQLMTFLALNSAEHFFAIRYQSP